MDPRPVSDSQTQLVQWMGVLDANSAGFIHGGTVMKLCDEAAGAAAVKHSRCRVVTAGGGWKGLISPGDGGGAGNVSALGDAARGGAGGGGGGGGGGRPPAPARGPTPTT